MNPGEMTIRSTRLFGLIGCAFIALAALLAVGTATAETPSEKADALLTGLIKTNDPGVAILVAQNGKILFEKGYGLADREHHVPVIPQTIFRICSITKQFTAAAILKLQEEGKLSVDDNLSKYISDFPRGDVVTLRQLLTHTSGIHSYTDESDFVSRATNATTDQTIIEEIKKYPYDFDPGTKFNYDNSGYLLLGYIVEKVSGQAYGDFLRENFFQPLGMTNTGIYRAHLGLPHEALGYSLGTNGFKPALNDFWVTGAGALYSTVEDLYRWNEGIFKGHVLNAASRKMAFTPVKLYENQGLNRDTGYGFGWDVYCDRGLREITHGGGLDGFRSWLLRVPDEKFTVAILANYGPGSPNAEPGLLVNQLMEIFLAKKLALLPVVNTKIVPNSYDALAGRYDFIPGQVWGPLDGGTVTISRRGMHLFEQSIGPELEIFPKSDTEFFLKGTDAQITFVKDSNGKVVKLTARDEHGIELDASKENEKTAVPQDH